MNNGVNRLRMLAAIWGCCYPKDREFVTVWRSTDDSCLELSDAADRGAYSFQVEGLLVRYALHICNAIPISDLPDVRDLKWLIARSDWSPSYASEEDWNQLRNDLYAAFYSDGAGFFAHDLKFADMAINHMKAHSTVVAGSCSRLPDDIDAPA
ncbi:hypothetical protein [Geopseudomonas aromaticivorans]